MLQSNPSSQPSFDSASNAALESRSFGDFLSSSRQKLLGLLAMVSSSVALQACGPSSFTNADWEARHGESERTEVSETPVNNSTVEIQEEEACYPGRIRLFFNGVRRKCRDLVQLPDFYDVRGYCGPEVDRDLEKEITFRFRGTHEEAHAILNAFRCQAGTLGYEVSSDLEVDTEDQYESFEGNRIIVGGVGLADTVASGSSQGGVRAVFGKACSLTDYGNMDHQGEAHVLDRIAVYHVPNDVQTRSVLRIGSELIESTAIHEMGHLLGLDHNTQPEASAMDAVVNRLNTACEVGVTDVEAETIALNTDEMCTALPFEQAVEAARFEGCEEECEVLERLDR